MLRGWRLRARWPAPIHPELAEHRRAGVSCSYRKFCTERDIFPEEREKLARVPAARGERGAKASADGARRTSRGRRLTNYARQQRFLVFIFSFSVGPARAAFGAGHAPQTRKTEVAESFLDLSHGVAFAGRSPVP